jgi:endoglucanase
MLGDNPRRSSYVVGFGNNPPRNPHHRTAHGAWGNDITTPPTNAHTLFGALVGGPDAADGYADSRTDFVRNEVATDYNAAFTGALARMFRAYGGSPLAGFPEAEVPSRDELFVEAAINTRGANFVEIAATLNNQSAWPARAVRDLTLRYYFTLDSDSADISLSTAFNECGPATGPFRWTAVVYYVQVSCEGRTIAPTGLSASRRQTQFRITSRGEWLPENDWSYAGLPTPGQGVLRTARIVLYEGTKKVWGEEPPLGPPQPLAVAIPPELPEATAGAAYRVKLEAAGGSRPYVKWELSDGALPDGLTLDSVRGEITGIPTSPGSTSFGLRVTDSAAATAAQQFTLTVGPPAPLTLATRALSQGIVGAAYTASFQAEGGIPPYAWKITEGELPEGLTLNGHTLSGTPIAEAAVTLGILVTDANGGEAYRAFELSIGPRASPADSLLRVQYRTNFADTRSNQIGPLFRIMNAGGGDVPLSELTVRYYFSVEDPKPLNYWCDWAMVNCENVRSRFVDVGGGKFYLEVSFTVSAGVIPAGGSSGEVQSRVAKDDWSFFDQSNDYSFDAAKTTYADWERIVLYRNGALVWGVAPSL